MKQFLITRTGGDPDSLACPERVVGGFDSVAECEEYIKERDAAAGYHFQVFEGVSSYKNYRELRKTPLFHNNT